MPGMGADKQKQRPFFLALTLGVASATGFAPLSFWPLSLFALGLLIRMMDRADSRRSALLIGWAFGVGHFTLGLNWIAHAFTFQDKMPHWFGYGAVLLLSLYLAVYPALATWATYEARRRWKSLSLSPLFAALWIITEYGRATLFTGFAWNPLGAIWLDTGVDQSAQWVGTYGLSGLAILTAGSLLALIQRRWRLASMTGLPLLALGIWGVDHIPQNSPNTGVAITVVQPNINQDEKHSADHEADNYAKLATFSRTKGYDPQARLIFWPEAAIPAWLDMEPEWRFRLAALLGPRDLLMTGNVKVYFKEQDRGFYEGRKLIGANNSVWVLTPQATLIARYSKSHLVPYGEYLPMRQLLQPLGLSRLVPGDADFWPGPGPRSLTLPATSGRPPLKMGVQICYEVIFSGQVIDRANRPDFLFNPSNDAWFGSWGPPQHLAQARLRAIEEAMPVIRSTPTGISAVMDAHGQVIASLPHKQAGGINSTLPSAAPPTFFARHGNSVPLLLALALVALAVVSARLKR